MRAGQPAGDDFDETCCRAPTLNLVRRPNLGLFVLGTERTKRPDRPTTRGVARQGDPADHDFM